MNEMKRITAVSVRDILDVWRGFSVGEWLSSAAVWTLLFALEFGLYVMFDRSVRSIMAPEHATDSPSTIADYLANLSVGIFEFVTNFIDVSFLLALVLLAQLVVSIIRIGFLRKLVRVHSPEPVSTSWVDLSAVSILLAVPSIGLSCCVWGLSGLAFSAILLVGVFFLPLLLAPLRASRGTSFREALVWPFRAIGQNPVITGIAALAMLLWIAPIPAAFMHADLIHRLVEGGTEYIDPARRVQTTVSLIPLFGITGFFAWICTGTAAFLMETPPLDGPEAY